MIGRLLPTTEIKTYPTNSHTNVMLNLHMCARYKGKVQKVKKKKIYV